MALTRFFGEGSCGGFCRVMPEPKECLDVKKSFRRVDERCVPPLRRSFGGDSCGGFCRVMSEPQECVDVAKLVGGIAMIFDAQT
jgi:hypothetical protein